MLARRDLLAVAKSTILDIATRNASRKKGSALSLYAQFCQGDSQHPRMVITDLDLIT